MVNLIVIFMAIVLVNNFVLSQFLGICSFLGVSNKMSSSVGMGGAVVFVMVIAELVTWPVMQLLNKFEIGYLQTVVFILVIAALVQFVLQAYAPDINKALGVFIPLIVVNCIILGRAEAFANKNTVIDSALDGIGMGLGFTLALACMGAIREFFGTGCLLGITIIPNFSIGFFNLPPGGFFVFGVLIAIIQAATKGKALKAKGFSCGLCPMYNSCNTAEANEELEAKKAANAAPAV